MVKSCQIVQTKLSAMEGKIPVVAKQFRGVDEEEEDVGKGNAVFGTPNAFSEMEKGKFNDGTTKVEWRKKF